ncbi:MAG: flagellar basal body rod protein FlgB [Propionibacteriales bacterium]|nr:flagellar basal body rod protein FlgB [Propionibacteriales bacterium]
MPFAVSDSVSQVLAAALDGVSLRQQVIADNLANVDTPGFRATSVDFESQLKAAISDGSFDAGTPVETGATTTPTDTPVGANGNNVDLRKEAMAAVQSQFQYQILTRAVTDKFNVIKTAVSGQ